MDQLQPLLKHRFWILSGLALVLIPVGWWLGTGRLAAEIEKQKSVIESAIRGIPQGTAHPNKDKWIQPAEKVNKTRARLYQKEAESLWKMQHSRMIWPGPVAAVMSPADFLGRGVASSDQEAYKIRGIYADLYEGECRRIHRLASPVKIREPDGTESWNPEGLLVFPYESYPRVPEKLWQSRPPTFLEMWEAQIDNWLMTALLQAIDRVNREGGARSISDASIREIVSVELRGGSRSDPAQKKKTPVRGDDSEEGGNQNNFNAGFNNSGDEGQNEGGSRTGRAGRNAGVLPTNELGDLLFGPQVPREEPAAAGGNPRGRQTRRGNSGAGTEGEENQTVNKQTASPWVDNDPKMPFKTRGFIIQLVMKRQDIPRLVQELTDAGKTGYPVEILWINTVDRDLDFKGEKRVPFTRQLPGNRIPGENNDNEGQPPGGFPPGGRIPQERDETDGGLPPDIAGRRNQILGQKKKTGQSTEEILVEAALNDPEMSYVVIAGLLTIYQPPPKEAPKKTTTSSRKASSVQPSATKNGKTGEKTGSSFQSPQKADPKKDNNPTAVPGGNKATGPAASGKQPLPQQSPNQQPMPAETSSKQQPKKTGSPTKPATTGPKSSPGSPLSPGG